MSQSSSGSWSDGEPPRQVINLDRFMRGAVRPSRDPVRLRRNGLVIDPGGVSRPAMTTRVPPGQPEPLTSCTSSERKPYSKRYSQDSGLSDDSYSKKKHRSSKYTRCSREKYQRRSMRETSSARSQSRKDSADSLRAFRCVCERALLDQQQQIAKMTQLCQRLVKHSPAVSVAASKPVPKSSSRHTKNADTSETSEISSSSLSTRDSHRKHKTGDCKTYKIIMNKLDELNRLFVTRSAQLPHSPQRRPSHLQDTSSGSVCMTDKIVETDPLQLPLENMTTYSPRNTFRSCPNYTVGTALVDSMRPSSIPEDMVPNHRPVANICALDITPLQSLPGHSKTITITESMMTGAVGCSSSRRMARFADPRIEFDLDDPIHLYAQSKRLRDLTNEKQRVRSEDSGARTSSHTAEVPNTTLCAVCRRLWRTVTRYISGGDDSCPD